MTTATAVDSRTQDALTTCIAALNKLATYQLEPPLQRRLDDLGARKEFLEPTQHAELLALVDFSQRRTIDALESRLALARPRDAFPTIRIRRGDRRVHATGESPLRNVEKSKRIFTARMFPGTVAALLGSKPSPRSAEPSIRPELRVASR